MAKLFLKNNNLKESKETKELVEKLSFFLNENRFSDLDFETTFNLNPNRANVLSACDIKNDDECLEVFSSTGALTGFIASKCKTLDCVEQSKLKSEFNLKRNQNFDNLNIFIENIDSFFENCTNKYDKIFLIGGLTSAPLFYKEGNSYVALLEAIKAHLKPNGSVFVACDNKYGMKNFNGAFGDHSSNVFESIEGDDESVRNFSIAQLKQFFAEAGYKKTYFYYPLPDYKFANIIFSDKFLPEKGMISNLGHSLEKERVVFFNEDKALTEAALSGMFDSFSNSFLVRAGE